MSSTPQAITGVILAGGQSSRMGQNKALMSLGGKRLVDRVVEVMREVFRDLLMVTNTPEVYADLGIPMVRDVWPEKGSLGGVYSAIYHVITPYCLVVACDMPFLNAAVLRYLITQMADYDVIIPDVLDELQTLHAIYSKACLQPIENFRRPSNACGPAARGSLADTLNILAFCRVDAHHFPLRDKLWDLDHQSCLGRSWLHRRRGRRTAHCRLGFDNAKINSHR